MDRLRRAVFGRLGPRWKSQDHHRGRIDLYLRDGTGSPAAIRFTTRAAEYGVATKELTIGLVTSVSSSHFAAYSLETYGIATS